MKTRKKKLILVCLFLGVFGVHRFMLGRKKSAIAMLLLSLTGISSYWAFVDLILIAKGKLTEHEKIESFEGIIIE